MKEKWESWCLKHLTDHSSEPVLPKIIRARLQTRIKKTKTTVIQVYSPTNDASENDKKTLPCLSSNNHITIVMGDLNAKVGRINTGREKEMGRCGLGCMNENGEMFTDFGLTI